MGTVAAAGSAVVEQGASSPARQLDAEGTAGQHSDGNKARQSEPRTVALGATAGGNAGGSRGATEPVGPQPVRRAVVRAGCQQRQLEQFMAAAERSGATKCNTMCLAPRAAPSMPPASACQQRTCRACRSAAGGGRPSLLFPQLQAASWGSVSQVPLRTCKFKPESGMEKRLALHLSEPNSTM